MKWEYVADGVWSARSEMSDLMPQQDTYWVIEIQRQGTFKIRKNTDLDCEAEWEFPTISMAKTYCERCECELMGYMAETNHSEQPNSCGPLNQVMRQLMEVNVAKGWNDDIEQRSEGDWAALNHTEISEAYESFRNGEPPVWIAPSGKPEGAAVEYIDCLYRILHWFSVHGIDPDEVFEMKLAYNRTRPYRHGGKKA
jgi:hypothetical protein